MHLIAALDCSVIEGGGQDLTSLLNPPGTEMGKYDVILQNNEKYKKDINLNIGTRVII